MGGDLDIKPLQRNPGADVREGRAPLGHHIVVPESVFVQFGGATVPGPEEETVAESVAYVACAHFGLDTGERSFPYVATWCREPRIFRAALGRIQALSASLIDRLTTNPDATSP